MEARFTKHEQARRADDLETGSAPEDGGWEFDEEVTEAFEDMLERSIPNYSEMRKMVTCAALWFADEIPEAHTRVLDIGCSRGGALRPIVDRLGRRGRYVGLEVSEPMVQAARQEFKEWLGRPLPRVEPTVDIRHHDLRAGLPADLPPQTVILSVLTMQFVPVEYRLELLGEIYDALRPGGGFVLVEKVLGPSPALQRLEADLYHDRKRGAGYSQEAIDRKRMALEGRLVPFSASYNEEMLRGAGFRDVDCVWAWMNFRGWLALKGHGLRDV